MSERYLESVCKVFGKCLEGVCNVSGSYLEGFWKVSDRCLLCTKRVSERYREREVKNLVLVRTNISWIQIFLNSKVVSSSNFLLTKILLEQKNISTQNLLDHELF